MVSGFTELSKEFLKWMPDCGYTERTDLVTALREIKPVTTVNESARIY